MWSLPARIVNRRLRRRSTWRAVIKLLNERGEIINELRGELHSTRRDLASQVEKNRRTLEIQFTHIAQLQQEIDRNGVTLDQCSPDPYSYLVDFSITTSG